MHSNKVNRGFDLPAISLVVIGFGTASRSKYEQMCGRAQRVLSGKPAAWVLDYGGHGQRFGSANWDWPAPPPADGEELIDAIKTAALRTHLMLRRIYDSHYNKIKIAPVGFRRDGVEYIFDSKSVLVTEEWLRQRAYDRIAHAEAAE